MTNYLLPVEKRLRLIEDQVAAIVETRLQLVEQQVERCNKVIDKDQLFFSKNIFDVDHKVNDTAVQLKAVSDAVSRLAKRLDDVEEKTKAGEAVAKRLGDVMEKVAGRLDKFENWTRGAIKSITKRVKGDETADAAVDTDEIDAAVAKLEAEELQQKHMHFRRKHETSLFVMGLQALIMSEYTYGAEWVNAYGFPRITYRVMPDDPTYIGKFTFDFPGVSSDADPELAAHKNYLVLRVRAEKDANGKVFGLQGVTSFSSSQKKGRVGFIHVVIEKLNSELNDSVMRFFQRINSINGDSTSDDELVLPFNHTFNGL
jgi:hypothetical protein